MQYGFEKMGISIFGAIIAIQNVGNKLRRGYFQKVKKDKPVKRIEIFNIYLSRTRVFILINIFKQQKVIWLPRWLHKRY